MTDMSEFRRGDQLLGQLRRLPAGMSLQVTRAMLQDIVVPANPLDRQTPEYLIEWLHGRMPFYCTVTPDLACLPDRWTFHRPKDSDLIAKCVGGPMDGTPMPVGSDWKPGWIIGVRGAVEPMTADDPIYHPLSMEALTRMVERIHYYRWDGDQLVWPNS